MESGDGSRSVCLADFGLAVQVDAGTALSGWEAEGAPQLDASALGSLYSAPELGIRYGFLADIFSLGMVLLAIWSTVDAVNTCSKEARTPNAVQSSCEDALVTTTELVKKAAADSQQVPGNILRSIAEGADSSLRELVLRMVSSEPERRPSAEQACQLVQQWFSRQAMKDRGMAESKQKVKRNACFSTFCKCLRPASPKAKQATEELQ